MLPENLEVRVQYPLVLLVNICWTHGGLCCQGVTYGSWLSWVRSKGKKTGGYCSWVEVWYWHVNVCIVAQLWLYSCGYVHQVQQYYMKPCEEIPGLQIVRIVGRHFL